MTGLQKAGAALLVAMVCLPAWHWGMSGYEARRYPPRGQRFAGLHLYCQGAGDPAVVFEAGLGGEYLDFIPVQKQAAQFTRACTYDRAGLGWSRDSPRPRTAQNAAAELLAALSEARIEKPVLLVAHSYGALVALSVAVQAPERLAGLVLLDPSYPAEVRLEKAPSTALLPVLPALVNLGVWRFRFLFAPSDPRLSPEANREAAALTGRTGHVVTFFKEIRALADSSRFLETHPARLTGQPVIVLARELPAGVEDLSSRHAQQRDLAGAFPRGRFEVVPGAGHFIHLDAPEVVAATVRETVQSLRLRGTVK